jgi:hypothetical protein
VFRVGVRVRVRVRDRVIIVEGMYLVRVVGL